MTVQTGSRSGDCDHVWREELVYYSVPKRMWPLRRFRWAKRAVAQRRCVGCQTMTDNPLLRVDYRVIDDR